MKQRNNFDPSGRRGIPADWSNDNVPTTFFLDRGFTGHEHLDEFNLINMNGRIYDPLLAMFLSPDNYVQSPDLSINFNRYSYALNNPLVFIDPSGNTKLPAPKSRRDGGWGGFGPIASAMAFTKYGAANTFAQMGMHDAGGESFYYDWNAHEYKNIKVKKYHLRK